jgi:hypothetical protein
VHAKRQGKHSPVQPTRGPGRSTAVHQSHVVVLQAGPSRSQRVSQAGVSCAFRVAYLTTVWRGVCRTCLAENAPNRTLGSAARHSPGAGLALHV